MGVPTLKNAELAARSPFPARLSPSPPLDPVLAALPPGSGDLAAAGGDGGSALLISSLVDVS
jgi:hypothetical protein